MKKILIIRLTSLGDVIFTLPLVNTLKDNDYEVSFLVAEKGLGIIKKNPSIKNVHFAPLNEWRKNPLSIKSFLSFINLIKEIRAEKYEIALDCQQMFKSLFLFLLCGAKRRITFKDARELSVFAGNEFITPKANFRDYNYHIVERNLDFARHLGINPNEIKFSLPESSNEAKNKIDEITSNFEFGKPIVVISPATTWKNKHWNSENWAKLAESIHEKCNLVFTGTKKDKDLIESILINCKIPIKHYNITGHTNIEELKELFCRSIAVISPDSGSSNLAWASSIPAVITIFTCTPAKRFGPYGNEKKYFAVQANLNCQPCFKKKCKLKIDKNKCTEIPSTDDIINIVNKVL